MNVKISVFVICVKAIIYLPLCNLHDCTFNFEHISVCSSISIVDFEQANGMAKIVTQWESESSITLKMFPRYYPRYREKTSDYNSKLAVIFYLSYLHSIIRTTPDT